jgi:ABC-type lipoprotein export system ATPase subunit
LSDVKALKIKTINPNYKSHGMKVPFRSIIIGASGSGKTNILLNLISQMKNTFNKIIIYTRNKKEPLYEYLEKKIEPDFLEIHEGLDELKNKKIVNISVNF